MMESSNLYQQVASIAHMVGECFCFIICLEQCPLSLDTQGVPNFLEMIMQGISMTISFHMMSKFHNMCRSNYFPHVKILFFK